jgi:uroporphyrinogen-III synthase
MARVLITRPDEDAAPLARLLESRGHECLIEPMLAIRYLDGEMPDPAGFQGLIFTSANGVRAFLRQSALRTATAWCVGDATARAAKEAGFGDVRSAAGDVQSLADHIAAEASPADGPLLHVAGSTVAGDLAGLLLGAGFAVERAVLYEAETREILSAAAREALASGTIDAVALFSPRTARTFARLVRTAGLGEACGTIDMLCLSRAVADALDDLPRKRLLIADEPTQDALIERIA